MSLDNDTVIFYWVESTDTPIYNQPRGEIKKKEAVSWLYFKYFKKPRPKLYDAFDRYLWYTSRQKPYTQLSIFKWVYENIVSI